MSPKPTEQASLLDMPSGTELSVQVYKPHAAAVQIVAVAPDGRYKVLTGWTLSVEDLVAQNTEGESLAAPPEEMQILSRAEHEAKQAEQENSELIRRVNDVRTVD